MYLDTTILQSRTTTTLVEFIDVLIDNIGDKINKGNYKEIKKGYKEIKRQQRKAKKHEEKEVSI